MARPLREAPTPSSLPPALLRYVSARNVDATDVAAAGSLSLDAIDADEVPITSAGLGAMLEASAEALADPHLALRLPTELRFRRHDALSLAAQAVSSARAFVDLFVRFAPLVFPALAASAVVVDGELRVSMRVEGQPRSLGLATDEYLLAFALAHSMHGEMRPPLRAWLTASRPRRLEPLYDALGTNEIDLGAAETGFALILADAEAQRPGSDDRLVATAEDMGSSALVRVPRRGSLASLVGAAIEKKLPTGVAPTNEEVASGLHMSARTLQRRLDEEGTGFSRILDGVRERVARDLLQGTSQPLGEVAYRAGFADLATFSRAFKRWSGMPPGAYRRQLNDSR